MKLLKYEKFYPLFLTILLTIVTLPRFNRNDIAISSITDNGIKDMGDAKYYIAIVEYFRGQMSINDLSLPFTYRPLVPLIASSLPFDAMTSINIVNLLSMLAAIILMSNILTGLNFSKNWIFMGNLLFIISFPVFYYATIGYVDTPLIFLLVAGLYFLLHDNNLMVLIILCIGFFVKETIILLLIVWFFYNIFYRKFSFRIIYLLIICIFTLYISYSMAKNIIPIQRQYIWKPDSQILFSNIQRPRTWISFLLSFGVPGILCTFIYPLREEIFEANKKEIVLIMIVGLVLSLLLFSYSLASAYADGRFIWVSYPFTVPLSLMVIKAFYNKGWSIKTRRF